jgi:hypothetical protein
MPSFLVYFRSAPHGCPFEMVDVVGLYTGLRVLEYLRTKSRPDARSHTFRGSARRIDAPTALRHFSLLTRRGHAPLEYPQNIYAHGAASPFLHTEKMVQRGGGCAIYP